MTGITAAFALPCGYGECNTLVGKDDLNKILEANMTRWDENPVVIMLEDRGRNLGRNQEKI